MDNFKMNIRIGDTVKIIGGDKRNIGKIAIVTGFMDNISDIVRIRLMNDKPYRDYYYNIPFLEPINI